MVIVGVAYWIEGALEEPFGRERTHFQFWKTRLQQRCREKVYIRNGPKNEAQKQGREGLLQQEIAEPWNQEKSDFRKRESKEMGI